MLAPPGDYDKMICSVTAMQAVATITVAFCYYIDCGICCVGVVFLSITLVYCSEVAILPVISWMKNNPVQFLPVF